MIAQGLEKVFLEMVVEMGDDTNGKGIPNLKTVSYTELIPVIIKGIQEQQQLIEWQKSEIEELKNQLQNQQKEIEAIKVPLKKSKLFLRVVNHQKIR